MNVNPRINLPLHARQFVSLLLLFAVCFSSVADAQEVTIVGESKITYFDHTDPRETSFGDRAKQLREQIRQRLVSAGADDQTADAVTDSVVAAIEEDTASGKCDHYTCEKKKSGWFWRRNSDPQRWYPGKVLGEAAGDVYWTAKVTLFLTIACPFVIVAFFVFGIAWLIFRPRK